MGSKPAGPSSHVSMLFRELSQPGANLDQIRAGAEGMLPGATSPEDQAWLHFIAGRSFYMQDRRGDALDHMQQAYSLATEHNIKSLRGQAGLSLAKLYQKLGQREKAQSIRADLIRTGSAELANTLAALGDATAKKVGRGLINLGTLLNSVGHDLAARTQDKPADGKSKPADPDTPTNQD